MIGEEGADLGRPPRERQKDIGHEARLFLYRFDPLANVLWEIGKLRRRVSADWRFAHDMPRCFASRYRTDCGCVDAPIVAAFNRNRHREERSGAAIQSRKRPTFPGLLRRSPPGRTGVSRRPMAPMTIAVRPKRDLL